MTSPLEESPRFVSPVDDVIHIGAEIFQGERGDKGGVAVRMVCGWKGFVRSRQLVQDDATCKQCVELNSSTVVVTP